ncbi:MAG: LD-carboxypeptidase [Alphaproteobacteria bacterium]
MAAPACRIEPELAERVQALALETYGDGLELVFHPQCFLSHGHFAGPDAARRDAFVELANDDNFHAVWFARGGYGACRIAEDAIARLNGAARRKAYLGYSDMGMMLAGLYAQGIGEVAHGPMPCDLKRTEGVAAVRRALSWLAERDPAAVEPAARERKTAAFNIATFSQLLGTPLQPDLTDHVLMLEEIDEHLYRIDRFLFHVTSNPGVRRCAGLMLGRCSEIPENDPDFQATEEEVFAHWCERSGLPDLGRADIGHDAENKVVPFGGVRI